MIVSAVRMTFIIILITVGYCITNFAWKISLNRVPKEKTMPSDAI